MPRFAANLSMLYPDLPFLDRFEAAARDGFRAVECLFPYACDPAEIAARLRANGLQQVLVNAPPGDWERGERGLACLPDRDADFVNSIARALAYAAALGCPRIHVMAGRLPADADRARLRQIYVARLRRAAAMAAEQGTEITIEPLNARDMPDYLLRHQHEAHAIVTEVGAPNLKVQMDLYHCQIVEGDLATKLRTYVPTGRVGHMQIAGVPARHEPDGGEVNYPYLFALLDELGYTGWIGCEYRPRAGTVTGGTTAGLGWLAPYR